MTDPPPVPPGFTPAASAASADADARAADDAADAAAPATASLGSTVVADEADLPPLRLVPLHAELPPLSLEPGRSATVGRSGSRSLVLPAPEVSRLHAEVLAGAGQWLVVDLDSRAGTRIEEQRIAAGVPTPLRDGDRLAFGPCSYLVRLGDEPAGEIELSEAEPTTRATPVSATLVGGAGGAGGADDLRRFAVVLRALASAADREALHRRTASAALETTGHGRAAIVEATGATTRAIAVVLERGPDGRAIAVAPEAANAGRPYSRRLVEAALAGEPVVLGGRRSLDGPADLQTVADLAIEAAVCVPIHVGDRVRACLYLDSRADDAAAPGSSAATAELLAAACGLALGNLARAELEGRQRAVQRELEAAQEAQRRLLPEADGALGPLRWAMAMQPGLAVAGDLFDVVGIDEDRTAVVIGDVAGHGIGPGLQMAMTQSVLRTELQRTGDPREAVERAHEQAARTVGTGRFVTLWVGLFERGGRVQYVDAGHGHVRIRRGDALVPIADRRATTPAGLRFSAGFEPGHLTLAPGEQLLLWSDGLVEQAGADGAPFGEAGVARAVAGTPSDPAGVVEALTAALARFRGGIARTDDVTVAAVDLA